MSNISKVMTAVINLYLQHNELVKICLVTLGTGVRRQNTG